jgi:hypothetical protein
MLNMIISWRLNEGSEITLNSFELLTQAQKGSKMKTPLDRQVNFHHLNRDVIYINYNFYDL